jgi:hypothetical protein
LRLLFLRGERLDGEKAKRGALVTQERTVVTQTQPTKSDAAVKTDIPTFSSAKKKITREVTHNSSIQLSYTGGSLRWLMTFDR